MKNLTSPRWIVLKGLLFLFLGVLSAGLLVWERPSFKTVLLLGVVVWSFCRFYYFAFYVLERYVDPSYRYSGLGSLVAHFVLRKGENAKSQEITNAEKTEDTQRSPR